MRFDAFLKQMGRNIRAARVRCGLRQVDVEEKIGLESRHYQKIEAGKINVTVETLYRLAKLFKTTEQELLRRD